MKAGKSTGTPGSTVEYLKVELLEDEASAPQQSAYETFQPEPQEAHA